MIEEKAGKEELQNISSNFERESKNRGGRNFFNGKDVSLPKSQGGLPGWQGLESQEPAPQERTITGENHYTQPLEVSGNCHEKG